MKKHFTLSPIFQDNMVFQANKPIRIFGDCKKGIELHIELLGQEMTIRTNTTKFMVEFDPMPYQDKGFSFTINTKKQEETIYNCLIGDVFLFVGGKNAFMPMEDSFHRADYEDLQIRLIDLSHGIDDDNNLTRKIHWRVTDYTHMDHYSALSYVFAKQLRIKTNNPLGIISCAHFETTILSWLTELDLDSSLETTKYIETMRINDKERFLNPGKFYQEMISKVVPFALATVIVYEGENDYHHAHLFKYALGRLIHTYRSNFNDPNLPFIIVQIAGYLCDCPDPTASSVIREVQGNMMSEEKKIYITTAVDLGEEHNDYLKDKLPIAKRLANVVLERYYKIGKNSIPPAFYSYNNQRDQMVIYTQYNYLNLVSRSMNHAGFYYSTDGEYFRPITNVRLMNNQIIIKDIEGAVEVRYAYTDYPILDFFTTNGLPLLPFRITLTK